MPITTECNKFEKKNNKQEALDLLLFSIAEEEMGLARIVKAEAEKIEFVLKCADCCDRKAFQEILAIDKAVEETMKTVIEKEVLLLVKLDTVLSAFDKEKKEHYE